MISTDTKQRYLLAFSDIDSCFLKCSDDVRKFLADWGVWQKWCALLRGAHIRGRTLEEDYQFILTGLDKAVEDFPDDPWARAMRGRATVALGYYKAAMQDLEWALDRVVHNAMLNMFYGEACLLLGKATVDNPLPNFHSAVYCFSIAIRLDPYDPRPYFMRAKSEAHVVKFHGYFQFTDIFANLYQAIQDDLRLAREHSEESGHAMIDVIEQEINALLGIG